MSDKSIVVWRCHLSHWKGTNKMDLRLQWLSKGSFHSHLAQMAKRRRFCSSNTCINYGGKYSFLKLTKNYNNENKQTNKNQNRESLNIGSFSSKMCAWWLQVSAAGSECSLGLGWETTVKNNDLIPFAFPPSFLPLHHRYRLLNPQCRWLQGSYHCWAKGNLE